MTPTFEVLGDPHLGRAFIHGVPLARRGEREAMVWDEFTSSLLNTEATYHVNMGDLFDKAIVSYDTIIRAAAVYNRAAIRRPNTTFIILKGNHDLMRDLERKSAFDLFAKLVAWQTNIRCITKPEIIDDAAFFPYDPLVSAADAATDKFRGCTVAYGHWDTNGFGSEHNVIPVTQFKALGITEVFTGHVHKPEEFERNGVNIHVVGSMQPYAHGEEINEDLYLTTTLNDLASHGDISQKCVRVLLEPDEMLDQEIDCLQLTVKRGKAEDDTTPTVTLGEFDMEALFREAFAAEGIPPTITETLLARYHDQRLKNGD